MATTRAGSNQDTVKLVTWNQLLATVGVLVTIMGGFGTFVMEQHVAHPHAGAVTNEVFDQFEVRHGIEITEAKEARGQLNKKLDDILSEVRK